MDTLIVTVICTHLFPLYNINIHPHVDTTAQQCTVETILSSNAPTDTDTRKVVRRIMVILCRLYILAMISAIGYFSFNVSVCVCVCERERERERE